MVSRKFGGRGSIVNQSDCYAGSNLVVHPAVYHNSREKRDLPELEIRIRNYREIVAACGQRGGDEAMAALLERVQRALTGAGVASPEANGVVAAFVWCGGPINRASLGEWFDRLSDNLALEPATTHCGPVHLDVSWAASSGPVLSQTDGCGRLSLAHAGREEAGRAYLADMALVSPVLAAIGGFTDVKGPAAGVDVRWRPVCYSDALSGVAFYEASIGVSDVAGAVVSSDVIVAAAERLGLVHHIDQYLATRVVDELAGARGSVLLAFSVSSASLARVDFWSHLLDRLEASGAVARDLIVEVRGGGAHRRARPALPHSLRGLNGLVVAHRSATSVLLTRRCGI
jgi:hypothetical protein